MYLYLISQTENNDYDTYDSAVVAAESEEQARNINPHGDKQDLFVDWTKAKNAYFTNWATDSQDVKVTLIGEADSSFTSPQVICASYNAG